MSKTPFLPLHDFAKIFNRLDPEDCILDVRTEAEFQEGHVPGSMNISHEIVADHTEELAPYKTIYIYCRRGARARTAYEALKAEGFENLVCIADAGMDVWKESGYPIVTS